MKRDFTRVSKSEEPTREKVVGVIELSDQDLAGVVGGDGGHHEERRHREEKRHHEEKRYRKY